MLKIVNNLTIKVIWNGIEVIGDRRSSLFAQPLDSSIEIPDPSHVLYEVQPTTHGNRQRVRVNDSDRNFTIPVVLSGSDNALATMKSFYDNQVDEPLKIVSIEKSSEGTVIAEYDSAMLISSPTPSTISADFPVLELQFSVGVQVR